MSSDPRRHEALIDARGAELTPVRRLLPPWLRTLGWLLAVVTSASIQEPKPPAAVPIWQFLMVRFPEKCCPAP